MWRSPFRLAEDRNIVIASSGTRKSVWQSPPEAAEDCNTLSYCEAAEMAGCWRSSFGVTEDRNMDDWYGETERPVV
ncbi:hypothetical protein ACIQUL_16505 [Streptomyces sp. NPDC090303]|uniref:hypothetical protein n=1 Tax=Streptomyces sp. NPDC090303 TaxID=3365960 RepID=UPI0038196C7A